MTTNDEDQGTEAEYLEYGDNDHVQFVGERRRGKIERPAGSHYRGGDREQPDRWRCLTVGCNPRLDEDSAAKHRDETGHRVAKWPVRSTEGKRRARQRNRTGYYDRYNVGVKSAAFRLGGEL